MRQPSSLTHRPEPTASCRRSLPRRRRRGSASTSASSCPRDESGHPGSKHRPRDAKLLAWARAAARRRRTALPVLWLFTDDRRLPDPRPAASGLPKGLAGVVFRHDGAPNRIALARDLARICRDRRLALVVAGDVRLAAAIGAGVHLRGGCWPGVIRLRRGWITSSVHNPADMRRATRAGADLAFFSPVFPTASHPGARALGPARWAHAARAVPISVGALGGIDGGSVRRLPPRLVAAVAAIGALA
ncbi:MAG: thiamine phosphate synthase [Acetobacteraceae bacterium]|nr:thiamine phosphate synthase [Acetobacteraceae bacterium]